MPKQIIIEDEFIRACEINGTTAEIEINKLIRRNINEAKEKIIRDSMEGKTLLQIESES